MKNTESAAEQRMDSLRVQLERLPPLPRVLHITWPRGLAELQTSRSPMVDEGLRSFIRSNPSWRIQLADNRALAAELRRGLSTRDYALMRRASYVEKSDVWRLLVIHRHGGCYSDVDRLHNVELEAKNGLIERRTRLVLPQFVRASCGRVGSIRPFVDRGLLDPPAEQVARLVDLSQDFFCSSARSPLIAAIIQLGVERRNACHSNAGWFEASHRRGKARYACTLGELGPSTFFHAATQWLLGSPIPRRPPPIPQRALKDALSRLHPFVTTYRETPPFATATYRLAEKVMNVSTRLPSSYNTACAAFLAAKRALWAEQGVRGYYTFQNRFK